MKATIKIFNGKNLSLGAEIALEYHLYVDGWDLVDDLEHLKLLKGKKLENKQVAIAYIEGLPVGCGVTIDDLFMVFVNPDMRRLGLAKSLYFSCMKSAKRKIHFGMVIKNDRAKGFYESLITDTRYKPLDYVYKKFEDAYDRLWHNNGRIVWEWIRMGIG